GVVNQGSISANVNGGTIWVSGQPVINSGSMSMSNGGSLVLNSLPNVTGVTAQGPGALTLNGAYAITAPLNVRNSTLNLNGNWTNLSSITVSNTTVNLGGNFTLANLGNFLTTNGAVFVVGALNNTNTTLALNNASGSWALNGGSVAGGT